MADFYTIFDLSVWYVDGRIMIYTESSAPGELVAFRRDVFMEDSDGDILPENFFDDGVTRIKEFYRRIPCFTDSMVDKELTNELRKLYEDRDKNRNLIYSTRMFSVEESDYYLHREVFPDTWEDCFKEKDYIFYLGEDCSLRCRDKDDKEVIFTDGYFRINAISLMDSKVFYEEEVCHNREWRSRQKWSLSQEPIDCTKIIPVLTPTIRARYPKAAEKIDELHSEYGICSDKECFAELICFPKIRIINLKID